MGRKESDTMNNPHKKILHKTIAKIQHIGNSNGVILTKTEMELLGLQDETEIIKSVEDGKKGKYLAVWKK